MYGQVRLSTPTGATHDRLRDSGDEMRWSDPNGLFLFRHMFQNNIGIPSTDVLTTKMERYVYFDKRVLMEVE